MSQGVARALVRTLVSALALAAAAPAAALGAGGGVSPAAGDAGAPATATTPTPASIECAPAVPGAAAVCPPVAPATLVRGVAVPPAAAPDAVKAAIAAANRIRTKPYLWGGGHSRWWSAGYDCSGAVSYALHGAGLLDAPLTSGEMMRWGEPGRGRWITVYANAGHAFAVISGLRWDTAGDQRGSGPRWHRTMVSTAGYVARHPAGY